MMTRRRCSRFASAKVRLFHKHDRLDYVEYLVDTLIGGDSYERTEVIDMVMTDSKLQKLQKHLEKARKEEKHIGEQEL